MLSLVKPTQAPTLQANCNDVNTHCENSSVPCLFYPVLQRLLMPSRVPLQSSDT